MMLQSMKEVSLMICELRKLSIDDGRDVYEFLQNLDRESNGFINSAYGMTWDEFRGWLERSAREAERKEIDDGWRVPQTIYWLIVDGEVVGFGKLRHFLTDRLRVEGGHIGYAIAKEARGRGYGKLLLAGLLREAKAIGIERALVTVNNSNTASIRTAVSCGGVIEQVGEERHYIWFNL